MKNLLLIALFSISSMSLWSQNVKKIVVKSEIKGCWAAIITEAEAKSKENEYGWWSAWQSIKAAKTYKKTPAVFKNIPKGKYIIVIYNPASKEFDPNAGIPGQTSDGVVLEEVDIQDSKTFNANKNDFKDWNCLSCPWLYIWNGADFVRKNEVIKDVVGKANEQTTFTTLSPTCIINQKVRIKIQEEKDEISYLNQVVLKVGDKTYLPQTNTKALNQLQASDNLYHQLKKGEMIELEFELEDAIGNTAKIVLETKGYYEPDQKFLAEIYRKYLKVR